MQAKVKAPCPSGKVKYLDFNSALTKADIMSVEVKLYVYFCPQCKFFHHTRQKVKYTARRLAQWEKNLGVMD